MRSPGEYRREIKKQCRIKRVKQGEALARTLDDAFRLLRSLNVKMVDLTDPEFISFYRHDKDFYRRIENGG